MKLRSGVAFVLMIVLIAGGVVIGAYKGWTKEQMPVKETRAGLDSMLETRVESAYNVLAVAKRHVQEDDEAYQRVLGDLKRLEDTGASLEVKAQANDALTKDAAALLADLAQSGSVKGDDRDLMYVTSYLPQMLAQSEEKTASAAYNQAAAEFNTRLKGTFSGMIARLLGISPAEEFIAK